MAICEVPADVPSALVRLRPLQLFRPVLDDAVKPGSLRNCLNDTGENVDYGCKENYAC